MRVLALAVLTFLGAATLLTPVDAAAPIGTSGKIFFDSGARQGGVGTYEPHTVNSDGAGAKRLVAANGFGEQIAVSPDGQRIAFTKVDYATLTTDIWVANADGSSARRLAGPGASPSWSPDGSRIAYDSSRFGNLDIFIAAIDGSSDVLFAPDLAEQSFPSWSPDGTRISYEVFVGSGDSDIWVANVDGSNQRAVTQGLGFDWMSDWSPNGKQLVFDRDDDVWIVNADGGGLKQLTFDPGWDGTPDWAPDGSEIVFHSERSGNRDLYTMSPNGASQTKLVGLAEKEWFPEWAAPVCTIASVVDGDTFDCTDGTRVNMLQIDAPELGACGGDWAKSALQNIFLPVGRKVALAFDTTTTAGSDVLAAPIALGTDQTSYNISIVMAYVGLAKSAQVGASNTKYQQWASDSQGFASIAQWNMWAPGKTFNGGC